MAVEEERRAPAKLRDRGHQRRRTGSGTARTGVRPGSARQLGANRRYRLNQLVPVSIAIWTRVWLTRTTCSSGELPQKHFSGESTTTNEARMSSRRTLGMGVFDRMFSNGDADGKTPVDGWDAPRTLPSANVPRKGCMKTNTVSAPVEEP